MNSDLKMELNIDNVRERMAPQCEICGRTKYLIRKSLREISERKKHLFCVLCWEKIEKAQEESNPDKEQGIYL
jgi:ribosomal protein S14